MQDDKKRSTKQSLAECGPIFRSAVITRPPKQQLLREEDRKSTTSTPTATTTKRINSGAWNIPTLTTVGLYYPIGACNVRLTRDRLSNILSILPKTFQKMSLQTTFCDSPVSATCYSMDNVELEISLFAGRTGTTHNEEDELIVEIERKAGDAFAYHKYADRIMNAILGHDNNNNSAEEAKQPATEWNQPILQPATEWNQRILQMAERMETDHNSTEHNVNSALETAGCMLSTDRYDVQHLGLESLVHMTDPYKSGLSVAMATAKCLLAPKTAEQKFIAEGIFNSAAQENDDNEFADMSLVIVAQILAVAVQAQMDTSTQEFLGNRINQDLVMTWLLKKVHDMQTNPHRAYYAVQSLVAMCEWFPSLRTSINAQLVQEARIYGDSCHSALATASHRLLICLQA